MTPVLSVTGLTIGSRARPGDLPIVSGLDLEIGRGECLGLVGESGGGKTLTALALLGLLPPPLELLSGRILLGGRDLREIPEKGLRELRGREIGMAFQEPASALDPVFSIGFQIAEVIRSHEVIDRRAAKERAARLLQRVGLPSARERLTDYPHELSGGQRQRVMLAMALAANPQLLIADEPTTALDVTLQAQILDVLDEIRRDSGIGVLIISHDLALVAERCDRVAVLYSGQIVETAPSRTIFARPAHPYTRGLLMAMTPGKGSKRGAELRGIPGSVPEASRRPKGCCFHPRCPEVMGACKDTEPMTVLLDDDHSVRCLLTVAPRDGGLNG